MAEVICKLINGKCNRIKTGNSYWLVSPDKWINIELSRQIKAAGNFHEKIIGKLNILRPKQIDYATENKGWKIEQFYGGNK